MQVLLFADSLLQLLLSDGRFTDAQEWSETIPPSWPAAHAAGSAARAWIAHLTGHDAIEPIHEALGEATSQEMAPLQIEMLELLAIHIDPGRRGDVTVRLLSAAANIRKDLGLRWRAPYHQTALDDHALRLQELEASWLRIADVEASPTSLAEAVGLAQRMRGRRSRPTHGWASLTPTERAVAREISAGNTNSQAAAKLFIAPSTVKSHLERIYHKLIHGRAALATETARHTDGAS